MARESLLQMLEDLASKVRSLERENGEAIAKMQALERDSKQAVATIQALECDNRQAAAMIEAFERGEKQAAATIQELEREKKQATLTIQGLEREVGELGAIIAVAIEKVNEMLKDGATDDISQPQTVNAPVESRDLEQMGSFLLAQRKNRDGALAALSVLTSAEVFVLLVCLAFHIIPHTSGAL